MLSDKSFAAVTQAFFQVSGIKLSSAKRALVEGRLQKLAQQRGAPDVDTYVDEVFLLQDPKELVRVVDKLTTNETYFFREPQHFDYLADMVVNQGPAEAPLRVWSAASSSGEEAYSLAMLLADKLGLAGWKIIGTDLSTAMVETAQRALYPMERAANLPRKYLKTWCRRGQGEYEGKLLVAAELRNNVHFECANLTQTLPNIGMFDVIFLRNVLIYFDAEGKADIVTRVLTRLKPGGRLFTGHAESLSNLDLPVRALAPSVYEHS